MDNTSQFFSNCSNLTIRELVSINLAFSATGAACCVVSSLIVLLLLVSKAYKSVLQRLFLYMMVATAARELFLAASIEHHFKYEGQEGVCTWIAFMYNWTGILLFVYTAGILVFLFFLVRHFAKGNTVPRIFQSKRHRVVSEALYVILSVLVTLCYATTPLFTDNYGLAGPLCWIRALDEDCHATLVGLLDQLLNGYIFFVSRGVIGVIMLVAMAVVYCRLSTTLPEARRLLRKTFCVIVFFLVYTAIMIVILSARMITAKTGRYQHPVIWLSVGITYPMSFLLFPVAFLLCFYSVGKACKEKARACFSHCKCCTRHKRIQFRRHVYLQQPTEVPTFVRSSRVSAPSSTFFRVPFTNNFTHIPTTTNASQHRADTGYGSIMPSCS